MLHVCGGYIYKFQRVFIFPFSLGNFILKFILEGRRKRIAELREVKKE